MNTKILDGRTVRDSRVPELIKRVGTFAQAPMLAIIQVGNRPDSTAFISAKKAFAAKIGVKEDHIHLDENVTQTELLHTIEKFNHNPSVQGIIVQLPLPAHINRDLVINSINPKKDADGLLDNQKSAAARGVKELLDYYNIDLQGKNVTIVGYSDFVGKPIAEMSLRQGASVNICDSKTSDLAKETKKADIIITAVGQPHLLSSHHVREGQTVIDVGIVKTPDGKLVGDVDFESVKNVVSAITPVPGGIGPMTVLALFENLIDLVE